MPKYLVEVPHENSEQACMRAVETFLRTGSHFLTHADWGCKDGEHKAWLVIEVDSKNEARQVVPPEFRAAAKVVQLNTFSPDDMLGMAREHPG
jgi:hypothetical protein